MPGKVVKFDQATLDALNLLAGDRMMDFQELADEAFRDLLKKHHRPTTLKAALRQSTRGSEKPSMASQGRSAAKVRPAATRIRGRIRR